MGGRDDTSAPPGVLGTSRPARRPRSTTESSCAGKPDTLNAISGRSISRIALGAEQQLCQDVL